MPASTRSRANDCSQTRSGIQKPRIGGAQAVLQPAGVAADLADAVPRGNHRQDRLEIGPAEDLDPPLLDQLRQPVDVLGLMRGEPFHQRAADVQRNLQRGIAAEDVEKVAIAVVERPLENVVEVADGLMVVQGEDETDAVGHDGQWQGLWDVPDGSIAVRFCLRR